MSKLPTFGLADIPKDWDIELDAEFVQWLDTLNRPWHYKGDGKYIPGRTHNGRVDHAPFWEAGWYSKKRARYKKLRTKGYFKRQELFSKLWGYHRYHDAHTSRYGSIRHHDRGNWIKVSDIPILKQPFKGTLTDSDLEELIIGLRKGKYSDSNERALHFKRLPIVADKWWAWLFGNYFSSGCIYYRERYYDTPGINIRLRAHEDVIPLIVEACNNVGSKAVIQDYIPERPIVTDVGLGTTIRRVVQLGWPEYLVFKKFGLPTEFRKMRLRGTGSRAYYPKIPSWIKANDEFMKYLFEGYINGSRGVSHLCAPKTRIPLKMRVPQAIIYVHCNGKPKEYVIQFLLDIQKWLKKQGVTSYFHRNAGYLMKGLFQYRLWIINKKSRQWLLDNFDIARPEMRARLFIKAEADKDPALYEVLREIRTPDNVILGLILEQPTTEEALCKSLQMRPEGITKSLQRLLNYGVIARKEAYYYYEPDKFIEHRLSELSELQAYYKAQIWKYSGSLLYQCENCQKVYIRPHEKCRLCGAPVQPTDRAKILRHLVRMLSGPRTVEAKLKQINSP